MTTVPEDTAEDRPDSLPTALMRRHLRLLREAGDADLPPGGSGRQRALDFVTDIAASGRLLDAPAERRSAQAVLDYWVASLNSEPLAVQPISEGDPLAGDLKSSQPSALHQPSAPLAAAARTAVQPVTARLEQPDDEMLDALAGRAERLWKDLAPSDGSAMVTMLLALLEPDDDRREFRAIARRWSDWVATGAAGHPGGGKAASALADRLVEANLVLASEDEDSQPLVELVSGGLARIWPPLAEAVAARSALRSRALLWKERGGTEPSLLNQVRGAPDAGLPSTVMDPLERAYLSVRSDLGRRRVVWGVLIIALTTVVIITAVIVALVERERAAKAQAATATALARAATAAAEERDQREWALREKIRQAITTRDLEGLFAALAEAGIAVSRGTLTFVEDDTADAGPSVTAPSTAAPPVPDPDDICRGAIWTGPAARYLRGAPVLNAPDWAGRRLQTTAQLRLRAGVPDQSGQRPAIGILPAGTEVVAQGNPVPDPTQRESPAHFLPITAEGPRCVVVYVQYAGPQDRARTLSGSLSTMGYTVPGGQRLDAARGMSEVRFYYQDDAPRARALAQRVRAVLPGGRNVVARDLQTFPGTKPPPGTVELWVDLSPP